MNSSVLWRTLWSKIILPFQLKIEFDSKCQAKHKHVCVSTHTHTHLQQNSSQCWAKERIMVSMNRKYFWKMAIYIFMLFEKFFKNVCLAYSQSLVMSPKFFDDQPLLHRKKYSGTWPIFAYLWLVLWNKNSKYDNY